jgi:hypothetical protein
MRMPGLRSLDARSSREAPASRKGPWRRPGARYLTFAK